MHVIIYETYFIKTVDAGIWVHRYIEIDENWEISFLCGTYNVVVYKFDLDVPTPNWPMMEITQTQQETHT